MQLLFIEGVPGSGKSTLAELICRQAQVHGMDAEWYLEEMKDHPVHPYALRAAKSQSDFPEHCLRSWQQFLHECGDREGLRILEGSMFQSSVRFMLERGHAVRIDSYFRDFLALMRECDVRMIYIRPREIASHIDWIASVRGPVWDDKVTAYLERTSYCVRQGLEGRQCMHRFWGDYAELCDGLISQIQMPCLQLDTSPGDWDGVLHASLEFASLS